MGGMRRYLAFASVTRKRFCEVTLYIVTFICAKLLSTQEWCGYEVGEVVQNMTISMDDDNNTMQSINVTEQRLVNTSIPVSPC